MLGLLEVETTLRNQIIHGGAPCNSSANHEQLRDASRFLLEYIPLILQIMMQHPENPIWGQPFYPFVKEN